MLQYKTIEPTTLEILKRIQSIPELKETRLVDVTALAMQLGHRTSVDLDIFGHITLAPLELRSLLAESFDISIINESRSINIYDLQDVKVDFVNYQYE